MDKKILRIIDVNLNRAREGLRVCEDIARFILNDSNATSQLKSLRHKIKRIIISSSLNKRLLHESRDVAKDCATDFSPLEKKSNWQSIFFANIQRTKESLRVLEEFFNLSNSKISEKFKDLRFQAYKLEKRLTERYFK
ncbi:MAG: thiamine-phosphate pyrophosphorylase [Candidatus Omnitrophica bacterium]|nr:thiamine-phosphate pyrophosphorylase [Candidatus Omnitrophota bacterium]